MPGWEPFYCRTCVIKSLPGGRVADGWMCSPLSVPIMWHQFIISESGTGARWSQSPTTHRGRAACCRAPPPCVALGRCPRRRLGLGLCRSGSSCSAHRHTLPSILTRRTSKTTHHPLGKDTKSGCFWNAKLTKLMRLQIECAGRTTSEKPLDHPQ